MKNIPSNGIAGDPVGAWATAMEGAAGIGTVTELMLQSHTGTIELFPQVPPGEPASFKNLRARGGFVSMFILSVDDAFGDCVTQNVTHWLCCRCRRAAGHCKHGVWAPEGDYRCYNHL